MTILSDPPEMHWPDLFPPRSRAIGGQSQRETTAIA
jgi:hypothetical protein